MRRRPLAHIPVRASNPRTEATPSGSKCPVPRCLRRLLAVMARHLTAIRGSHRGEIKAESTWINGVERCLLSKIIRWHRPDLPTMPRGEYVPGLGESKHPRWGHEFGISVIVQASRLSSAADRSRLACAAPPDSSGKVMRRNVVWVSACAEYPNVCHRMAWR